MKTAMIWGSSDGIGSALTKQLLANDWRVIAISRDVEASDNKATLTLQADVTNANSVQDAILSAGYEYDEVNLWIYAAGDITMPTFDYTFTVDAPQEAVVAFHHDTSVLKTLTPPPILVQIHSYEPLSEGSIANFTLWFGPYPIHWKAIHSNVDENGFTDTQARGPLKSWQHSHHFSTVSEGVTMVNEHIEYEYERGLRGLLGRLLFSPPALTLLFTARKLITRRQIGRVVLKEQTA